MKKILLGLFLTTSILTLRAQQTPRADHIVDRNSGLIVAREFQPKPETVQSVYLQDAWSAGDIVFSSGAEVKNVPLKYDLKNDVIEVQDGPITRVLPLGKCKEFRMRIDTASRKFVNASLISVEGLTGMLEPIAIGKISLYSKPYLETYKANYNAAMNIGNRNDTYLVKTKIFIVVDGVVHDVTKPGKKDLIFFAEHRDAVEKFAEENALSYKKQSDFARMVAYYNQL